MRYALMRKLDISNGEGVGVSLFVQGCHFHCKGCFNPETWDFNGGHEWNDEAKQRFFELIDHPYIARVSILGGEPLAPENSLDVCWLLKEIKEKFPDKQIWVYTGFRCEDIYGHPIFQYIDVLVDGQFDISKQDIGNRCVKWAGSTNQRVIDVQELNSYICGDVSRKYLSENLPLYKSKYQND